VHGRILGYPERMCRVAAGYVSPDANAEKMTLRGCEGYLRFGNHFGPILVSKVNVGIFWTVG